MQSTADMQSEELQNMAKKLVEAQMLNVELEQDMAILRKKFRELLASKNGGSVEGLSR